MQFTPTLIDQIIKGRSAEFAAMMGMHKADGELQINTFLPGASRVEVLSGNGKKMLGVLECLHTEGFFSGRITGKKPVAYCLQVHSSSGTKVVEDPYRFPSCLDAAELQLFKAGRHEQVWQLLGAHPRTIGDCVGVLYVVWAPAVRRVSLLLPQNGMDGRVHVMRQHAESDLWELFLPGVAADSVYRFELMTEDLRLHTLAFDPFATRVELLPLPASKPSALLPREWQDNFWQLLHSNGGHQQQPVILHDFPLTDFLSSGVQWRRLARVLLPSMKEMGFTHLLIRDGFANARHRGSEWLSLLATPVAFGGLDELQDFIEQAHELELAIVWELPLQHLLPKHGSSSRAAGFDWLTQNGALLSQALGCVGYWSEHLHLDGVRLSGIDHLLALPVGNGKQGSAFGAQSRENPFAREWLGVLAARLRERFPSLLLLAETAAMWPQLTEEVSKGGMGMDYRHQPIFVNQQAVALQLEQLLSTFQQGNASQLLVCHSLSNGVDEISQQVLLLALWALPARKLLRLSSHRLELSSDWQPESGEDSQLLLGGDMSNGMRNLIKQLNFLYQSSPSLYEMDRHHEGINVLHVGDGIAVFERFSRHATEAMLVVVNASNRPSPGLVLRPQCPGKYRLLCAVGEQRAALELIATAVVDKRGLMTIDLPPLCAALCSVESGR